MIELIYETRGVPSNMFIYANDIHKLLETWLDDNVKGEWKFGEVNASLSAMNVKFVVLIEDDADAMAFKLRWL